MTTPKRETVKIAYIDLSDTRFKFRRNVNDDSIKTKAESIKKLGLLNAVKLWKQGPKYTVLAGWQRIMAVHSLNQDSIEAEVYEDISFEDALKVNIADNHLRENLSDYETACQMQALNQYHNYSTRKIAEFFGCGEARVYDMLSIFDANKETRDAFERGELTLYHVVTLNKFPISERSETLQRTLRENLSVKWLKRELANLKRHPLYRNTIPLDPDNPIVPHALKIPLSQGFIENRRAFYELIGKKDGMPGPMKCEFTLTTIAKACGPPYICDHDTEWVILAHGIFPKGGKRDFDWEEVPLKERDGWFFFCERCTKLLFPNVVLHRNITFPSLVDDQETYYEDDTTYP